VPAFIDDHAQPHEGGTAARATRTPLRAEPRREWKNQAIAGIDLRVANAEAQQADIGRTRGRQMASETDPR
jgi:hypothetical protein